MGDISSNFEGCITHGPWGGSDGENWDYRPEGFITKIIVCFKDVIDYIQFQSYSSKLSGETDSTLFGSPGTSTWIRIDYPDEYIKAVSGTYGTENSNRVVTSISFTTNQNHYGPFGTNKGTVFSYDVKEGKAIVGFHGRASSYLYAIGVYVMPKSPAASGKNQLVCESKIKNEKPSSIAAMPREAGPWGAGGGKPWDDGVFSSIKQVRVYLGKLNAVYALQFDYLRSDGECVVSQIHGGTDHGVTIELVPLDVEKDEYLMGFSGFYGPVEGYNGLEAIVSITFHTNVRIHGPYGEERGGGYVYFSSTAGSPGKVVGCHGRSNGFLSAIGVHMDYF
ncbi:hypothetical protein SSX86_018504 [Deinandra increscens subsp. villosa]|uniref:Jacalin-type lectin domain-containing protein n=1 Tax=Deinandra increscens subsp. villosa TaxID=3103831 RepID=A0AAP0CR04_9ASTR